MSTNITVRCENRSFQLLNQKSAHRNANTARWL